VDVDFPVGGCEFPYVNVWSSKRYWGVSIPIVNLATKHGGTNPSGIIYENHGGTLIRLYIPQATLPSGTRFMDCFAPTMIPRTKMAEVNDLVHVKSNAPTKTFQKDILVDGTIEQGDPTHQFVYGHSYQFVMLLWKRATGVVTRSQVRLTME
jgi:hypothetical protein